MESIARAIDLGPEHISAYTLSIEPATAFGRARVAPMPDDGQAEFYARVRDELERAGYVHYEVSSFARSGRFALHNTLYWTGAYYLGLGAGAHSHLPHGASGHAMRRENVRAPEAFLSAAERGHFPASFEEVLDDLDVLAERVMVGVRTRFGLDLADIASDLDAPDLEARLAPAIEDLVGRGLVVRDGTHVRPTPLGFILNDRIARALFLAVHERPATCLRDRVVR